MTYQSTVLGNSPVAYWRLGEAAVPLVKSDAGAAKSFTNDTTGYTLDVTGGLTSGDDDGAVLLAGSGLLVTAGSLTELDLGNVHSVEFWFKRTAGQESTSSILLAKGSAPVYQLRYSGSAQQLQWGTSATSNVITIAVPDNNWHHYVFTKNGSTRKGYRDGADQTGLGTDVTMTNNTSSLRLGGTGSPGDGRGTIDELALYTSVLTLAQAGAHYAAGLPATNPPPYSATGPFTGSLFPSAVKLPGGAASIFNMAIPASPAVHPDSAAMCTNLIATTSPNDGPGHLVANANTGGDVDIPIYFATSSDPLWTIAADNAPYGTFPYDGTQIRIPANAKPAAGTDAHICVVQSTGVVWDFYKVTNTSFPAGGGTLHCRWGGFHNDYHSHFDPQMVYGGAIAPNWIAYEGQIRASELAAGAIEHAIVCTIRCCGRDFVWPAQKNALMCAALTESEVDKVGMGHRIQLNYSQAEIDALSQPAWRKTIYTAMRKYGVIPGDTNGNSWQLRKESATMYTSMGYDDPLKTFAQTRYQAGDAGITVDGSGLYVLNIRDGGIDWSRLRIVEVGHSHHVRIGGEFREKPTMEKASSVFTHKPVGIR